MKGLRVSPEKHSGETHLPILEKNHSPEKFLWI